MSKPYLLLSDLHAHSWSAFASLTSGGGNSRLSNILAELHRAVNVLDEHGGHEIIIAGDLFHVRGQLDPEVFNNVHSAIKDICDDGFKIYAIPGNHDLKTKETTVLGNSFTSLRSISNFWVVNQPAVISLESASTVLIPWMSNLDDLRREVDTWKKSPGYDLIIHAGINGVIKGMPDHALEASEIADWRFKRVFAGHYHNHKTFCEDRVISIGATTHQTWSDVGSKAGFLLVWPDRFVHYPTQAPEFKELTDETPADAIPYLVEGNYVRIRGMNLPDKEINELRRSIMDMGALGFSYQGTRAVVSARTSAAPKSATLEESVSAYIKGLGLSDEIDRAVGLGALEILTSVRGTKELT